MDEQMECTPEQAIADFTGLAERFASLAGQTREQLLWRPDAGKSWCIAECVEHVALANAAYLENLKPVVARADASSGSGTLHIGGWLSALLLKSVSPQAKRKLGAPRKIRPVRVDPGKAFKSLAATHAEILALLDVQPRPDYNRVHFQNPFIPLVRFTVASAFLIMAAHGRRHLAQAERVREAPGFPGIAA
jgi:hypothetical protein